MCTNFCIQTLDPSRKIPTRVFNMIPNFSFEELFKIPQEICFEDTGTGLTKHNTFIDDEDTVICYDEKKDLFTCKSLKDPQVAKEYGSK